MGFRVAWVARSGESMMELLNASGRRLTRERHDFPDIGWYLLELPKSGEQSWVVLIADGSENFTELDESYALNVSRDGSEAIYFWCSDTVMATEMICYRGGEEIWAIDYNSERAEHGDHEAALSITGHPPPIVQEVLAALRIKQADGADYLYDLTTEVGLRLVGFRHDTDLDIDDPEPFQLLG